MNSKSKLDISLTQVGGRSRASTFAFLQQFGIAVVFHHGPRRKIQNTAERLFAMGFCLAVACLL